MHLDTYDEREMFSDTYPLLAAYPTVAAVASFPRAAVGRVQCGPGEAIRRISICEAWSEDNIVEVRIPSELIAAHAAEVASFAIARPAPGTASRSIPPVDEYRIAALAVMRREAAFDAARWALGVLRTDERGMLRLIEQSRDWCAWAPMIRFAHAAREHDERMSRAEGRLRLIARRVLNASGLTNVLVDDTLAHKPSMQQAICGMLTR
jgi:hypothetical protein